VHLRAQKRAALQVKRKSETIRLRAGEEDSGRVTASPLLQLGWPCANA
jgi:hypothetical protein